MRHLINNIIAATLLAVFIGGAAAQATTADVRAGISTRETYVGLPVTLQIQVSNAAKSDPPTIPAIDGLTIKSLGAPSRSTQTTIINGNMSTRSSVTYAYEVTPERPGSFRIPPISVEADGATRQTRAFDFVASKSETGDLLFVEIAGKEKQIYVGQSLDLVLKIWVRPYRDVEHGITLSDGDMWRLISERTTWGAFADRIQQLAQSDQRPPGEEVLRKDRDGVEHSYYLYQIDATMYPKKPGRIDANDVQIVIDFPTALGQSRDPFGSFFDDMSMPGMSGGMFGDDSFSPFGSRLTIESVRPIVAEAKVEPIEVLDVPTAGRPADYRGAVGQYRIITEASPSSVKAGDPINLLVGIAGTGPMDLVQAPPLADLQVLAADFKVPNEPLAGFVQGDRKVFSTTIRPRKAGVTEIPAIQFSYFDPQAGRFVTVRSKPISIQVAAADTLALDAVVGRSSTAAVSPRFDPTAESTGASPVMAISTGDDLLTNESPAEWSTLPTMLFIALPPLVVFGMLALRISRGYSAFAGRFGSIFRQCKVRIEKAERPADVALALRTLLARRFGLSQSAADATVVVGALRSAGYRNLAVRCERLLQQCDEPNRGFGGSPTLSDLKNDALSFIDELQTQRRPPRSKPAAASIGQSRMHSTTSIVVTAIALAGALLVASADVQAASEAAPAAVSLTTQQQKSLLSEASDRYNLALNSTSGDSAEAKQAFADASAKYQLLVDSGVQNSRLYFNLANAYLESGATGRAIANYRRSLTLNPTNHEARRNLAYAEGRLTAPAQDAFAQAGSVRDYASLANNWLSRYVSPGMALLTAAVAWLALWGAIGLRLLSIRLPWKSVAAVALIVAAVSASSYALGRLDSARNLAVIVSPTPAMRAGDGATFPGVAGVRLDEGEMVEWLKRRGDWVQIRTERGESGWLNDRSVEIL